MSIIYDHYHWIHPILKREELLKRNNTLCIDDFRCPCCTKRSDFVFHQNTNKPLCTKCAFCGSAVKVERVEVSLYVEPPKNDEEV